LIFSLVVSFVWLLRLNVNVIPTAATTIITAIKAIKVGFMGLFVSLFIAEDEALVCVGLVVAIGAAPCKIGN